MINEQFKYETKVGKYPVRFYDFEANTAYPIHGAIRLDGRWILMAWNRNGMSDPVYSLTEKSEWDLVKIRPQPKNEKSVIIVNSYPAVLPQRIVSKFSGKRVKITLEEV